LIAAGRVPEHTIKELDWRRQAVLYKEQTIDRLGATMLDIPLTAINETLEHLHGLSELLLDEVKGCAAKAPKLTVESRLCKKALQTIRVLVPKLEAVRSTQVAGSPEHRRSCPTWDD
jgi:hypothetical protein